MQIQLSAEAEAARDVARDIARKVIAPRVDDYRRTNTYPKDVHSAMASAGLLGGVIPEEWGGAGMSYQALVAMVEELATVDHVMAGQASHASGLLGAGILKFGDDSQKERYLRPLCEGKLHGAIAMSEPQGGSDVANMKTRATANGDNYVIAGQKIFVSHVDEADFFLTFAQTSPTGSRNGVCAFLVDRETPGIEILHIDGVDVFRPHSWGQVFFDDVVVPEAQRVGAVGDGLRVGMQTLEVGRMAIAARACGAARHCLSEATVYAKERVVFGRPIADYQMIQAKLADMAVEISAARTLVYNLAAMKDLGVERATTDAAIVKLYATEMLERAASATISIFGGYGLTAGYPWEQYLKDAKAFQIAEGTSEIQRMLIARSLIGHKGVIYTID